MVGLDAYSIPARLAPALLVAMPVGLAIGVWFSQDMLGWGIGGGVTVGSLLFLVMAERARRAGKAVELRLESELGARPTTVMLRHCDTRLERPAKERYHRFLEGAVPGVKLPTPEAEEADPVNADEQYASCTRYLLEQTRDRKQHGLVFRELVSYGFVRNLRGMRAAAIGSALVGLLACGVRAILGLPESVHAVGAVGTILSAFLLAMWWLKLNDQWVRDASFDYARALLASCDRINLTQ
ncbi:MAG: hypothetical protein RLN60_05705 [Phycisphaerales bacterium]